MRDLCNCYNKVMDDCRQLVTFFAVLLYVVFLCLAILIRYMYVERMCVFFSVLMLTVCDR